MPNREKEYNSFFNETYTLFKRVTSYAILLEKFGGGKVYIASINELRGVLFHLYKFLDENENHDQQQTIDLVEAKEHLYRAYYDLFSKLCVIFSEKIHNYQGKFGVETMSSVFPDYYKVIFPGLNKLKQDISRVRSTRDISRGISTNSDANHEIIVQLLDWNDTLESLNLTFIKRVQADKKRTMFNVLWLLVSAAAGAIITYLLTKPQ